MNALAMVHRCAAHQDVDAVLITESVHRPYYEVPDEGPNLAPEQTPETPDLSGVTYG